MHVRRWHVSDMHHREHARYRDGIGDGSFYLLISLNVAGGPEA